MIGVPAEAAFPSYEPPRSIAEFEEVIKFLPDLPVAALADLRRNFEGYIEHYSTDNYVYHAMIQPFMHLAQARKSPRR